MKEHCVTNQCTDNLAVLDGYVDRTGYLHIKMFLLN